MESSEVKALLNDLKDREVTIAFYSSEENVEYSGILTEVTDTYISLRDKNTITRYAYAEYRIDSVSFDK